MISCLNNFIGIRGIAGYEQPDSDYFINDLEGITTTRLEDISDQEDHYEPRLAFDDIYNRAARLIESDCKSAIKPYFKNFSETFNGITTQVTEKVNLTQGTSYNGWLFDFGTESQNRELVIEKIAIYLNAAVQFDITIFDASTGETLDTISFDGVAGLKEYNILKSYPTWKYQSIYVAYDDQVVDTIRTSWYHNGIGSVTSGTISNTATVLKGNINGADTGLMVNYSYQCSIDNFFCQRLNEFKDPFLYKLGIEFCKELIHSDRINRFTLMDRETAMELKESFTQEYKALMDNIFRDIKIHDHDECFECAKLLTYKQVIP